MDVVAFWAALVGIVGVVILASRGESRRVRDEAERFARESGGRVFEGFVTDSTRPGLKPGFSRRPPINPIAVAADGIYVRPMFLGRWEVWRIPWEEVIELRANRYDGWTRIVTPELTIGVTFEDAQAFVAECERFRTGRSD